MYLITVEGPDGSGKGVACRILSELLDQIFTMPSIWMTAEPRRGSPVGNLAIESVQFEGIPPNQQAAWFAADRLVHGYTEILPRLSDGIVVISDRNIFSSLAYQGIVGGVGVHEVASMNAAALRPDLVIWVDCHSGLARTRIDDSFRLEASNKREIFEEGEFPSKVRAAYFELFGSDLPAPFDDVHICGPIVNDQGIAHLRSSLKSELHRFIHARRRPANVTREQVDESLLKLRMGESRQQTHLPGLEPPKPSSKWLRGLSPATIFSEGDAAWRGHPDAAHGLPRTLANHAIGAIMGTLCLAGPSDHTALRRNLGPVRFVTERHSQRILHQLFELKWLTRRSSSHSSRDKGIFEVSFDQQPLAMLMLAIHPLLPSLGRVE